MKKKMKVLSTEELRKAELDILKCIAEFCDQKGLRYNLCGGTLLGAVRHHGFIPWDDDIDIQMPRPDYIRFVSEFNGFNDNYVVKSIENDRNYWQTYAKIMDKRIYLKDDMLRIPESDQRVLVDCFPVDGLPVNRERQKKLFREQEFLHILYAGSSYNYKKSKRYIDSADSLGEIKEFFRTCFKYLAITLFRCFPRNKIIKLINKNASKISFETSDEVASIVDCHWGCEKERMPRKEYEKRQKFQFEGEQFWGTSAYDLYLTNLYGDYMTPPPKDKQVSHHGFTAYWIDEKN